jgi:flavorubredoxin
VQQLNLLLNYFEYFVGLEEKIEKEMENKINDKRLDIILSKHGTTHAKLQGKLKEFQKCLEESKKKISFLFQVASFYKDH